MSHPNIFGKCIRQLIEQDQEKLKNLPSAKQNRPGNSQEKPGNRPGAQQKNKDVIKNIPDQPGLLKNKFSDMNGKFLADKECKLFGQVTNVISPSEIYFNFACANKNLSKFQHAMNEHYKETSALKYELKWEVREMVGDFCVCYFYNDPDGIPQSGWYRIQVLDWYFESSEFVNIQLVDYGNKGLSRLEDIRPLSQIFAEQPIFTMRCHLSNLRPPPPLKDWPTATRTVAKQHLHPATMQKYATISPTGKQQVPPFSEYPSSFFNHEKSVPVILALGLVPGVANNYLINIGNAEFDSELEVTQTEEMKLFRREKENNNAKRMVEEWIANKKVVVKH